MKTRPQLTIPGLLIIILMIIVYIYIIPVWNAMLANVLVYLPSEVALIANFVPLFVMLIVVLSWEYYWRPQ